MVFRGSLYAFRAVERPLPHFFQKEKLSTELGAVRGLLWSTLIGYCAKVLDPRLKPWCYVQYANH